MELRRIGFDLDGTLYRDTPQIRTRVRSRIYEAIAKEKAWSKSKAEQEFEKLYAELRSGSEVFAALDLSRDLMQMCLATADITDLLFPDHDVVSTLLQLRELFPLDLVTGSPHELSLEKLERLGLSAMFEIIVAGQSKAEGAPYDCWITKSATRPSSLLYVGDNYLTDVIIPTRKGIRAVHLCEQSLETQSELVITQLSKLPGVIHQLTIGD